MPRAVQRIRATLLALLVGAVVALAFAASPSHALVPEGEFGSPGAGDGQFGSPQRVAVQQSTERIFVVDSDNDRVQVFVDDGSSVTFVTQFGAGVLDAPVGVAVNQTSGDVYVTDSHGSADTGRIVRFNPDFSLNGTFGSEGAGGANGEFVSLDTGIAIDPVTSDVLVADRGGRVQRFGASGTFLSSFDGSVNNPGGAFIPQTAGAGPVGVNDVAVDSAGNVYVAERTGAINGRVDKFDASGSWLASLGVPNSMGVVSVDPVGGDVFATTFAFPFQVEVRRYTSAGVQVETLAVTPGFFSPIHAGVAFNQELGRAYVSDTSINAVRVFGPADAPGAITGAASEIRQHSAQLSGSVDANSAETTYHFEYGTDTTYGASVPVPGASAGLGDGPVDVSQALDGLAAGTTYHYRLVATNEGGTTEGEDQSFETLPALAPTVVTDDASRITQIAARISGTVDPEGATTSYRFEYGADTSYGTSIPVPDGDLGTGVDPVDVVQDLADLTPGTTYHYRLVATNDTGTTEGADHTFDTLPEVAPDVQTGSAVEVTDEVATVQGTVDPNGRPTAYRFEYGTTTSYGASVPVPDGDAGTANDPVNVAADLLDLDPDTAYHFRLVATSAAGTTEGDDHTFTTSSSPGAAPSQRAFELVTPADDLAYDAQLVWNSRSTVVPPVTTAQTATSDGEHVAWGLQAGGTLPGMAQDGEAVDFVIASRKAAGWDNSVPLGDRSSVGCGPDGGFRFTSLADTGNALMLNIFCPQDKLRFSGGLDQTPEAGIGTLYHADAVLDTATPLGQRIGSSGELLSTGLDDDRENLYLGGSADLSTVYFRTRSGLLPGVPTDLADSSAYVYKRSNGVTSLLTTTSDGSPYAIPTSASSAPGNVSRGGESFTFTATTTAGHGVGPAMVAADTNGLADVYQVRDGATAWISDPDEVPAGDRPAPQPAEPRSFESASSDGSKVYFSTNEQVTTDDHDAAKDLYVYDAGRPSGQRISRVSTGDGDDGPQDANLSIVSDDGRRVFFVTGDALDESVDTDLGSSLYVHELGGQTTYVAPATNAEDSATVPSNGFTSSGLVSLYAYGGGQEITPFARPIKLSADGHVAFFSLQSDVSLPAARGGNDSDGARDLYVWRSDGGLRRLRQGPGPASNTSVKPQLGCFGHTDPENAYHCRGMTADGDTVFFETPEPLAAADTNAFVDVYAADTTDGSIELVSLPSDTPFRLNQRDDAGGPIGLQFSAQYVESSTDGQDVFFRTRETLDPSRDLDGGRIDIYNARLGDAIPPLEPPLEPCEGDSCQSPPSPPRDRPRPGTGSSGSAENANPGPRARVVVRRTSERARSRMARSGRLTLSVRVNRPGRIVATGRAKVGGRLRKVASASKRAPRAGVVRMTLRLSKGARNRLARGQRLKVSVSIGLLGTPTRNVVVLDLRRATHPAPRNGR